MAGLATPMAVGLVCLDDGRDVLGFLCEAAATAGAADIPLRRLARVAGGTAIIGGVAEAELGRRRAGRPGSGRPATPRSRPARRSSTRPRSCSSARASPRPPPGRSPSGSASARRRFTTTSPARTRSSSSCSPSRCGRAWRSPPELESRCRDDPAAGLYALALIDVATLTQAPHNIATLYLMPEVQAQEFASFRAERAQLQAVYGRLGQAASAGHGMDEPLTAALLMQLVESVIQLRRAGALRDGYGHEIAAACLRLVGLGRPRPPAPARRRPAPWRHRPPPNAHPGARPRARPPALARTCGAARRPLDNPGKSNWRGPRSCDGGRLGTLWCA